MCYKTVLSNFVFLFCNRDVALWGHRNVTSVFRDTFVAFLSTVASGLAVALPYGFFLPHSCLISTSP